MPVLIKLVAKKRRIGRLIQSNDQLMSFNRLIDSVNPLIGSVNCLIDSVNPLIGSVNHLIDSVNPLIGSVNRLIDSVNPPIAEINKKTGRPKTSGLESYGISLVA